MGVDQDGKYLSLEALRTELLEVAEGLCQALVGRAGSLMLATDGSHALVSCTHL